MTSCQVCQVLEAVLEHADVGELVGYKIHTETTWRITFFGMNTIHFQILYKGSH
jgi:hypothetical protein